MCDGSFLVISRKDLVQNAMKEKKGENRKIARGESARQFPTN